MTMYARAHDVETIARRLIDTVEEHEPLAGVRIDYVYRDKASKSHGRVVLGTARKIAGLNAFLAADDPSSDLADPEQFFVIEIAHDLWNRLDDNERSALVDHELCHCRASVGDAGPVLSTRGHDIEEFTSIVRRHGLWSSNVAKFGSEVAEQLALALDEVVDFMEGLDTPPPDDEPQRDSDDD